MVTSASDWQLVRPSRLPLRMSGGDREPYKAIKPPEAGHSGMIYFHNYIIKSNHDNGAKVITVPAGANVIYTAYRNGSSRKSNWTVNAETKANCSSIVFNRNWWNVPSWFAEAMTTPKPDVYDIRGTDVYFTRLYDTGRMTVVGIKQIRFSGDKYSERAAIPSESNPWTEQEVVYSEPCAVFDLTAILEPQLSSAQFAKIKDDVSWTFASGRIEQDATNPLRATCHSPRQPGEYVVTASCGDSSRVMLVKVGTYKIHEVTFHNNIPIQKDTTSEFYTGYDWRDNDLDGISDMMDGANARTDLHYHPVAYVSTDISSATGTFSNFCTKVSASTGQIASFDAKAAVKKVRFAWNDSFAGWNWSASTDFGTGAVTLTASRPFASSPKVYYNEAAELAWEVGFGEQGTQDDDLSWHRSSSHHELHLTYKLPLQACLAWGANRNCETILYRSCSSATRCASESSIVSAVWTCFSGCNFKRKNGCPLTYYKSFTNEVFTVKQLLLTTDGQCSAWAELFRLSLLTQGIDSFLVIAKAPDYSSGFAVKAWNFSGEGTSGNTVFPYQNNRAVIVDDAQDITDYIKDTYYEWGNVVEVSDGDGIRGQNNGNPASLFGHHLIVQKNGTYFDPSYGLIYSNIQEFDDNLDGFYKLTNVKVLFQKNPPGKQIMPLDVLESTSY